MTTPDDEDHEAAPPSPSSASCAVALLDADQDLALLNALLDASPPDPPIPQLLPAVPSSLIRPTLPPAAPAAVDTNGPAATAAAEQRAPAWQALKTTRERQRAELTYLRSKVAQLEQELAEAAPAAVARQLRKTSDVASSSENKEKTWWAEAAQRQRQERSRSEAENAKLRDVVMGQIRLAKSLEKVLEKRRMWEGMTRNSTKRPRTLDAGEYRDSPTFAQLKRALHSRMLSADAIFQEQGLNTVVSETSDAAITYDDDSHAMRLNFKVVHLHPFEFRSFAQAAWRYLRSALLDNTGGTIIEQSEHSLALQLSYAPRPNLPLQVHSVFKRVIEPERVVVTWESEIESDLGERVRQIENHPQIRLRESGWGTIEPIHLPNTAAACITRHFTRATPTMDVSDEHDGTDAGDQNHSCTISPGALTDLIISYLQSVQLTHQSVDDMLLDEQLSTHRH